MKELNPLLHSQLRLAVMSILMNVEEADFVYLRQKTDSTAGNLSVQLDKLASAGYIAVEKGFAGKKTRTVCRVTPKGREAFGEYVGTLKEYLSLCPYCNGCCNISGGVATSTFRSKACPRFFPLM